MFVALMLLQIRRRYLWTHHCFRCRCSRCEERMNGDAGCRDRTAVEHWRRIEGKVGNLLKPQSLEEKLQNGSSSVCFWVVAVSGWRMVTVVKGERLHSFAFGRFLPYLILRKRSHKKGYKSRIGPPSIFHEFLREGSTPTASHAKPPFSGWKQLWHQLITWQIESEKVLPEDHWAMVHAALLGSYMAMTRYAEGFPLPFLVWNVCFTVRALMLGSWELGWQQCFFNTRHTLEVESGKNIARLCKVFATSPTTLPRGLVVNNWCSGQRSQQESYSRCCLVV